MTLDIFIAKNTVRICAIENPGEVVKMGIKCPNFITLQLMRFGPMRSSLVPASNLLECSEQFTVRYIKAIRPREGNKAVRCDKFSLDCQTPLVLHNSDPGGFLSIART